MAFRGLIEGDCGGANPLMQLGGQFTRDSAYKEEGFGRQQLGSGTTNGFNDGVPLNQEQMVNEFLGKLAVPPQTFRMDNLLEEMREIEQQNFHPPVINAPKVIQEVTSTAGGWAYDYTQINNKQEINMPLRTETLEGAVGGLPTRQHMYPMPMSISRNWNQGNFVNVQPVQADITYAKEFFDETQQEQKNYVQNFFDKHENGKLAMKNTPEVENITDEWLEDFQKNKEEEAEKSETYYEKFWSKLQKDWNDLAEYDTHPWLTQETDFDPYKEYNFIVEDNPMADNENALEKGKEFLAKGDIPSAVLCFEAAVKQETHNQNSYAWELLGLSQAENEMDPHAISALMKSLNLKPDNLRVLMALSVSYTNESLQSQALNMLARWLYYHPKYKHLVPPHLVPQNINNETVITSSLIAPSALKEIQNLFIDVVQKYPGSIDADVQEALGVLFNLSSEYDKAVDCFKAALHANPTNSKTWNRLGASLANGNRSVEAVEAYKRALELQPGFIRARYNVGIICMNLKSYKEAAEHLLTALNMQATSPSRTGLSIELTSNANQMSDVIWSTLRMVFALMARDDLKTLAANRDLDSLNREMKLT